MMIAFYDNQCERVVRSRLLSSGDTSGVYTDGTAASYFNNSDPWYVIWTSARPRKSEVSQDIEKFRKACRKLKLIPRRKPPKPEEHSHGRRLASPLLRSPVARRTCSGMARVLVPRGC